MDYYRKHFNAEEGNRGGWRREQKILTMFLFLVGVLLVHKQPSLESAIKHATDQALATDQSPPPPPEYIPSPVEKYITDHSVELGYNESLSEGCKIWRDPSATTPEIHKDLHSYSKDLENYFAAVNNFTSIPDLLESIKRTGNHDVCATARPHPNGIQALFPSGQLSHSKSGFVEPLLPPMRDQGFCFNRRKGMSMDYLVHDFEAMCKNLKPGSKRVLIDMGASLEFHGKDQPIMVLLNQFEKFGFVFDHIYAFEITQKDPQKVYDVIPEKYMSSYHWINVGVTAEEGNKLNPLHSILKRFSKDDFVVVKLDIDTSSIEVPLAHQLLEDKDGLYHELIDQFYFEHHVGLQELAQAWKGYMHESIKDSLDLFVSLRKKGIPAHFWP